MPSALSFFMDDNDTPECSISLADLQHHNIYDKVTVDVKVMQITKVVHLKENLDKQDAFMADASATAKVAL